MNNDNVQILIKSINACKLVEYWYTLQILEANEANTLNIAPPMRFVEESAR